MKSIDICLIYICIFCWSNLLIAGVHFDRAGSGESTLDEVTTQTISDSVDTVIKINPSESEVNVKNEAVESDKPSDPVPTDELRSIPEAVFSKVNSEYGGVSNEIINNDTPIIVSRTDAATEEIQKMANIPSSLSMDAIKDNLETIESNITNPVPEPEEDRSNVSATLKTDEIMPKNSTEKNAEDIPSFSEWAQKHLEEAEKKEQVNNLTSSNPTVNTSRQGGKLRWKNYASVDCGAKVILANPEAQHSWALLVDSRNEYMLNPCNSRIWFIVELCEAIQLKKIHLGNYELFSSLPKDFTVSLSNRFPTKDWLIVGQFTAQDERDVQNFDINTETFGKYVKVEIKSHYGSEHYCPLSLFRAYGTSEFEVLQKDDPAHEQPIEDDDDDDPLDDSLEVDSPGNLLSSAADAVLSMVKKAALVLGNKVNKTDESSHTSNETKLGSPIMRTCSSPSHYIVCTNCSDTLFGKIFELLSCKQKQIQSLVSIPFISRALTNSLLCQSFGLDFRDKTTSSSNTIGSGSASVESFFPQYLLGAMCNALAIKYNKVLYNVSHQYANTTENISKDLLVNFDDQPKIMPVVGVSSKEIIEEIVSNQPTEPLRLDRPDIMSKSSCSTDTTYASQIKPSKSLLATELPVYSELNTAASATMGQAGESEEDPEQQPQKIQLSSSIESPVETSAEVTTEAADLQMDAQAEDGVDKLITETNTETNPSVTSSPGGSNSQGQKESVFLRLSNRIKALERNMSLSSQYLEELSKRYKKQVEEIQRVLEKTTHSLNEVTTKMDERNKQIEDKLESLTKAVESLSFEINLWKGSCYCLFSGLFLMFLFYCINKCSAPKSATKPRAAPVEIQRRNSVDVAIRTLTKKKKRRPSDQALRAASAIPGDHDKQPKKRKKKMSSPAKLCNQTDADADLLYSPPSIPDPVSITKSQNTDWVEGKGRIIEDIPFPLEESDNSELSNVPLAPELSGIDAPSFITTAASRRTSRTSVKNGKIKNRKDVEKRQPSPAVSANGSISSASGQTPKKEKKGLKRLFKIF